MTPTFPMSSQINQAMETLQRCADQLPPRWKLTLTINGSGYWGFVATVGDGVAISFDASADHPIVTAVREARRRAGLDDGIPRKKTT